MKLTDWLGSEYGVGDKVIYAAGSGRSITMVFGEVLDIYRVYRSSDWDWTRLADGEEPPYRRKWDHDRKEYVATAEYVDNQVRVQLQPLNSSRWKQHSTRTRYIDTRSGRGIDPFVTDKKTGLYRHQTGGYFENAETGEKVHEYDYHNHPDFRHYHYWDASSIPAGWKRIESALKPYVKKVTSGPGPVTLTVVENIVKWVGPDAD